MAEEEKALQGSITNRKADLETFKNDAIQKLEDKKVAAKERLDAEEQQLRDSLSTQLADLETFKNDTSTKLDEIGEKYRTLFGDLGTAFAGIITGMGESVTRFVTEFLVGKLFKELGNLTGTILPGVGKALAGVFGGGGGGAGQVPLPIASGKTFGKIPGFGGGGAAGAASSGLAGTVGAVAAVGSLISDVISNFQFAAMNKSLDLIETETRKTQLFLGGRSDQGILGVLFDIRDIWLSDILGILEVVRDSTQAQELTAFNNFQKLESIDNKTTDVVGAIDNMKRDVVGAIRALEGIGPDITVNVAGDGTSTRSPTRARQLATDINRAIKLNTGGLRTAIQNA